MRFNSTHPFYSFFILKNILVLTRAIAYGSVSAVTFVTAITFLEMQIILLAAIWLQLWR
jgi:hypothetical protein